MVDLIGELFSTYAEWHYFIVGFFLAFAVSILVFVRYGWLRLRTVLFMLLAILVALTFLVFL